MKRIVKIGLFSSLFLLILIPLILPSVSARTPFSDVISEHPNVEAILYANGLGVIDGYPDGSFQPDSAVNRAELMKMVVEKVSGTPDSTLYRNCFPDVRTDWYAPYVCMAKENGWIDGYPDGYFRPSNKVNRAEALKIVFNAVTNANLERDFGRAIENASMALDVEQGEWYYPFFEFGAAGNLLDKQHLTYHNGTTYRYYPAGNMSRKEVVEMMYRYDALINNVLAQYSDNYGPYGQSMTYAVRSGLAYTHGYEIEDVSVEFLDVAPAHAYGMVKFGSGGPGQGGWFYARIGEGGWSIVTDGNGAVACETLEANSFPDWMREGCYQGDGWINYENSDGGFSIQYPETWVVAYEGDFSAGFAPIGLGYDAAWAVDWTQDYDLEELIANIGYQFADRTEKRVDLNWATKVEVQSQSEDFDATYVFVEKADTLYYLSSGAIGDERFVEFYESFELFPELL